MLTSPIRLVLRDSEGWRGLAACSAGPSAKFFPPSEEHAEEAKQICASCPVRLECTAYAISTGPAYGIWGGLDTDQLDAMRRSHSHPGALILGPDREMIELLETLQQREVF